MPDPTLSSAMSYAEILAVHQDYSDYDLVDSVARARLFIQATRMLLAYAIRRSGQASRAEEIEVEPEILERQLTRAMTWYASRSARDELPRQLVPDPDWREA